ncbi:Ger(x)C family spore germination protein [Cohnella suwonensis]|uniref:Ger(X)C family spore germination protein n=1 Tax=Cohnella suwonensis TaxID=696072 RepID=A0ABW0LR36_9BACL
MSVRKLFSAAALLFAFAALAGCGFKDIDKRFFVVTMGIDPGSRPDTVRVTLRLAIPSSKIDSGEANTEVEVEEAPTIAEAVRHIKALVDKELDFGQCRVFLLGKALLDKGVGESMEWMLRRRDVQMISFVGIAEPDAKTVLSLHPKSERYPGNALFLSFGNDGTESSYAMTEYLFDWARRMTETGKDAYMPVIRIDKDRNSYRIDKVAFMDKKKLRLTLDPEETQLYNLSGPRFGKKVLAVPVNGTRVVMSLMNVRTSVRIEGGNKPVVRFRVRANGAMEEIPIRFKNGDLQAIEREMEAQFNEDLDKLLCKIRDAGVDPYGFGLRYLASVFGGSKQWAYWKEKYPSVDFRVESRFLIQETGLID